MTSRKLEEAFAEAARIAGKLPKALQEAGFNRALDEILGRRTPPARSETRRRASTHARAGRSRDSGKERKDQLDSIDRTKHPDVGATNRVADQALKVLQIAKDDHELAGLTAPEIAWVLTEKFLLPATRQGVGQALARETRTVNVKTRGGKKVFHLMAPGETYLQRLRSGAVEQGGTRPPRGRSSRKKAKKSAASARTAKKAKPRKKTSRKAVGKKRSGRPGPKAAIAQLISQGYFDEKRKISEIQSELQHSRGHTFSVQELSPALVRSVRDQTLRRRRAESGQYEYSKA